MSSELYKRFRPKSLDKVVGNEATVSSLQSMLKKKKLPHTILFSGPSGCGKTTLARILAKELGCSGLDLKEMDCSSFRGIDTVRSIQRDMKLEAIGGDCHVWILDEIHQMSKDGQNAMLKMLEDTLDHVYFFLCTTDPQKLIKTIRSRCTPMEVKLLSEEQLQGLVKRVAKLAEIEVGKKVLEELVVLANGSARTALVLLEKISHLPAKEQTEAMRQKAEEEVEAIELCRALIKKSSWQAVAKILDKLDGDPEAVRWSVLGYARSSLVKGWGDPKRAYAVITAFEEPFYDSKEAGLARASYEAIFG